MYQHHMLLNLRKPILKYTLNKYHVHGFSSFKHLKLPISIKIPVTTVVPRPLSNDPRFTQYIYRYSRASKRFVEVYKANCLYLHDSFITNLIS